VRVAILVLLVVACKDARERCGDAVDEGIATHHDLEHTRRDDAIARDPMQRQALIDNAFDEDQRWQRRRDGIVDHCVAEQWDDDTRDCIATGGLLACLPPDRRDAIASEPPKLSNDRLVATLQLYANRMCRCADRACADRTAAAMTAFQNEMRFALLGDQVQAALERYLTCMSSAQRKGDVWWPGTCGSLSTEVDAVTRCDRLPDQAKEQARRALDRAHAQWRDHRATDPDDTLRIEALCRDQADAFHAMREAGGC
jgi:hypothetical protein